MSFDDHIAAAISDVVPALVRHLRIADADGRWHFNRYTDHSGDNVEVRFRSTPAVLDELEHRLRLQSTTHDWPVRLVSRERHDGYRTELGETERTEGLSALSSELALDLFSNGRLDSAAHLATVATHLRLLTDRMPADDRPSFLFLCWQHWSQAMTPSGRGELGERADEFAPEIFQRTTETLQAPTMGAPWRRYASGAHTLLQVDVAADGLPLNYLLFEHAQLAHAQLGIPLEIQALAARSLRSALVANAGTGAASSDPVGDRHPHGPAAGKNRQ